MFVYVRTEKEEVKLPCYQSSGASGMDVHAHITEPVIINPCSRELIPTGMYVAIPDGYEFQLRSRSGLALNHGIIVLNSPGTIDSDYRGEIKVLLHNISGVPFTVYPNDRIAQLVAVKIEKVIWWPTEELPSSSRGQGGYGSTGIGSKK